MEHRCPVGEEEIISSDKQILPLLMSYFLRYEKIIKQSSHMHLVSNRAQLFFIEVTVDLHAGVRNNTERALVYFVQFPPVVTFCETMV